MTGVITGQGQRQWRRFSPLVLKDNETEARERLRAFLDGASLGDRPALWVVADVENPWAVPPLPGDRKGPPILSYKPNSPDPSEYPIQCARPPISTLPGTSGESIARSRTPPFSRRPCLQPV